MNIVIVDDSRLARKELRQLIDELGTSHISGEAADIHSARKLIEHEQPELLLLDIQLPDGSGFDLLEKLDFTPRVIFTTAYEQHALQAFEINALDYLLKPISIERLQQALERAQSEIIKSKQQLPAVGKGLEENLFIRDGEHCHFVKYRELSLLEVDGNYVKLYFRNTRAMLPKSLHYVEARLDPHIFFRANRQQIINLEFIATIEPWVNDALLIKLQDGTEIESSRRQARELKQRLEL